ncbi:2,3-diketo-5-methylthio-1-phosphopentane phosphatase [Acidaminobacter sp. JC074]|uniref:MtnX-like HAD-IB family phosphatase n=1 Tax=Acidaminobacter sp. JC074 TaxID=2530199 RepID=UPI001F0FD936|nr:MtnX-like HAD-IB family phosphatase [Acidaminobacter sp. JC074]MCH4886617.1 2,3-diketo-5-methylthio-1-phosphopentane phosphatase [Acidaminobacter sp. JC074]
MKRLFVSDFDGTATALDFYKIVLNMIGQEGWDYVTDYRKTGKVDYHFLNKIFGWHKLSNEEYDALIDTIELDKTLKDFLAYLEEVGVDFKFVSAGFDKYIDDILEKEGYKGVEVMTNPGSFEEGIMKMSPDKNSPFYHDLFGIDKGKVMQHLKKDADKVYFAGDTEPDFTAALEADVVFAKGELIPMLEKHNKPYIKFDKYIEIVEHLKAGV